MALSKMCWYIEAILSACQNVKMTAHLKQPPPPHAQSTTGWLETDGFYWGLLTHYELYQITKKKQITLSHN